MKKILLALSTFSIISPGGDFEDGLKAYNSKNYKKAVELYQKVANQGNADSQNKLAFMYNFGIGVKQNYKKASELYQESSNQGNVDAQYNLGLMYELGRGVKQNYKKLQSCTKSQPIKEM